MKKEMICPITKREAEYIEGLLFNEPSCEEECFGEEEKLSHTVVFDDNYEASIELCGVQYIEGECNTAWSQGILFKNGCEICCTEPCDTFLGEWTFETENGDTYVVNVIVDEY